MKFQLAVKNDLMTVMTWIQDAAGCIIWAGPKVKFPPEIEQLYQALEFDKHHTYSLYDDKDLLALGQIRLSENNRRHLSRVIVNPLLRGKGIGRVFCKELIQEAKKFDCQSISLNVIKDNHIAIALYEKLGFITCSKRINDNRENVVYMELRERK